MPTAPELDSLEININTLNRSNYYKDKKKIYSRVGDDSTFSTLEVKKTTVGTTATRIETPDGAGDFVIFHQEATESLHIGGEAVTVSDVKVEDGDVVEFTSMNKNDANEIYGIVSTGTIVVFSVGVIKA